MLNKKRSTKNIIFIFLLVVAVTSFANLYVGIVETSAAGGTLIDPTAISQQGGWIADPKDAAQQAKQLTDTKSGGAWVQDPAAESAENKKVDNDGVGIETDDIPAPVGWVLEIVFLLILGLMYIICGLVNFIVTILVGGYFDTIVLQASGEGSTPALTGFFTFMLDDNNMYGRTVAGIYPILAGIAIGIVVVRFFSGMSRAGISTSSQESRGIMKDTVMGSAGAIFAVVLMPQLYNIGLIVMRYIVKTIYGAENGWLSLNTTLGQIFIYESGTPSKTLLESNILIDASWSWEEFVEETLLKDIIMFILIIGTAALTFLMVYEYVMVCLSFSMHFLAFPFRVTTSAANVKESVTDWLKQFYELLATPIIDVILLRFMLVLLGEAAMIGSQVGGIYYIAGKLIPILLSVVILFAFFPLRKAMRLYIGLNATAAEGLTKGTTANLFKAALAARTAKKAVDKLKEGKEGGSKAEADADRKADEAELERESGANAAAASDSVNNPAHGKDLGSVISSPSDMEDVPENVTNPEEADKTPEKPTESADNAPTDAKNKKNEEQKKTAADSPADATKTAAPTEGTPGKGPDEKTASGAGGGNPPEMQEDEQKKGSGAENTEKSKNDRPPELASDEKDKKEAEKAAKTGAGDNETESEDKNAETAEGENAKKAEGADGKNAEQQKGDGSTGDALEDEKKKKPDLTKMESLSDSGEGDKAENKGDKPAGDNAAENTEEPEKLDTQTQAEGPASTEMQGAYERNGENEDESTQTSADDNDTGKPVPGADDVRGVHEQSEDTQQAESGQGPEEAERNDENSSVNEEVTRPENAETENEVPKDIPEDTKTNAEDVQPERSEGSNETPVPKKEEQASGGGDNRPVSESENNRPAGGGDETPAPQKETQTTGDGSQTQDTPKPQHQTAQGPQGDKTGSGQQTATPTEAAQGSGENEDTRREQQKEAAYSGGDQRNEEQQAPTQSHAPTGPTQGGGQGETQPQPGRTPTLGERRQQLAQTAAALNNEVAEAQSNIASLDDQMGQLSARKAELDTARDAVNSSYGAKIAEQRRIAASAERKALEEPSRDGQNAYKLEAAKAREMAANYEEQKGAELAGINASSQAVQSQMSAVRNLRQAEQSRLSNARSELGQVQNDMRQADKTARELAGTRYTPGSPEQEAIHAIAMKHANLSNFDSPEYKGAFSNAEMAAMYRERAALTRQAARSGAIKSIVGGVALGALGGMIGGGTGMAGGFAAGMNAGVSSADNKRDKELARKPGKRYSEDVARNTADSGSTYTGAGDKNLMTSTAPDGSKILTTATPYRGKTADGKPVDTMIRSYSRDKDGNLHLREASLMNSRVSQNYQRAASEDWIKRAPGAAPDKGQRLAEEKKMEARAGRSSRLDNIRQAVAASNARVSADIANEMGHRTAGAIFAAPSPASAPISRETQGMRNATDSVLKNSEVGEMKGPVEPVITSSADNGGYTAGGGTYDNYEPEGGYSPENSFDEPMPFEGLGLSGIMYSPEHGGLSKMASDLSDYSYVPEDINSSKDMKKANRYLMSEGARLSSDEHDAQTQRNAYAEIWGKNSKAAEALKSGKTEDKTKMAVSMAAENGVLARSLKENIGKMTSGDNPAIPEDFVYNSDATGVEAEVQEKIVNDLTDFITDDIANNMKLGAMQPTDPYQNPVHSAIRFARTNSKELLSHPWNNITDAFSDKGNKRVQQRARDYIKEYTVRAFFKQQEKSYAAQAEGNTLEARKKNLDDLAGKNN